MEVVILKKDAVQAIEDRLVVVDHSFFFFTL